MTSKSSSSEPDLDSILDSESESSSIDSNILDASDVLDITNTSKNTIVDAKSPCGSSGAGLTGGNAAITNDSSGALGILYKRPKKISKYICGAIMGEGVFGTIRDAIDLSKNTMERVAIKALKIPKQRCSSLSTDDIDLDDDDDNSSCDSDNNYGNISAANERDTEYKLACIDNEVEMLQRFHHPNVIRAIDVFTRHDNKYLVLPVAVCNLKRFIDVRLEKMNRSIDADTFSNSSSITSILSSNGNQKYLANKGCSIRFSSRQLCPAQLVKDIAAQLLTGVSYIHLQKCFHNDLKPSNVLLFGDGTVKVADFGCCGSEFVVGKHGTPVYLSPQVVANLIGHELPGVVSANEAVDPAKNDAWACGCILYQLLTGTLPVACLSPEKLIMHDIEGTSCTEFNVYNSIVNEEINFDAVPVEGPVKKNNKNGVLSMSSVYLNDIQHQPGRKRTAFDGLGTGSCSAKDLIKKLLTKSQTSRISISQALDHPWMKEAIVRSPRAAAALTKPSQVRSKSATKKMESPQKNSKNEKDEKSVPLLSGHIEDGNCHESFFDNTINDPQGYICPPPYDHATLLPLTGSERNLRRVFNVHEISALIDRDYVMHVHLVLQVAHILKIIIPPAFLSKPYVPIKSIDENQPLTKPTPRSCLYHAIDGSKFIPEAELNYYSRKKKDDRDVVSIRRLPYKKQQLYLYMDGITMACERRYMAKSLGDIPGSTRGVSSGGVRRITSSQTMSDAMREFFNGYEGDVVKEANKKQSPTFCMKLRKWLCF